MGQPGGAAGRPTASAVSMPAGAPADTTGWPPATYAAADFRFTVECPEPALALTLGRVLAPLQVTGTADHRYRVVPDPAGRHTLLLDGQVLGTVDGAGLAVDWLVWHLNQQVVAHHRHRSLLLHGAAVAVDGTATVVPGASGAGKTTLTAALVAAGADYLTDEVVVLDGEARRVRPYPKPLTVKPGSWATVAALTGRGRRGCDGAWQVAPDALRPAAVGVAAPVAAVVVPRFSAGASARVRALDAGSALVQLTSCLFNLRQRGNRAVGALAALVRRCTVVELVFGDAVEGAAALHRAGLIVANRPSGVGRDAELVR